MLPVHTNNWCAILSKRVIGVSGAGNGDPVSGTLKCYNTEYCHYCRHFDFTEVPTRLPVPAVPEMENAWGTSEAAGWLGLVGVTGVRLSLQAVYWIPGSQYSISGQGRIRETLLPQKFLSIRTHTE